MPISHAPKAGALLTGAEWESEDTHIVTGNEFQGVLLHRTTNFTTTNANDSIPDFDTVVYDTSGEAWEGVTNQERITIPAAWDGLYMQFFASGLWASSTDDYCELKLYKNATRAVGDLQEAKLVTVTQIPPATSHNTGALLVSPPVLVETGDYFTITFRTPANETLLTYENASVLFGAYAVQVGTGMQGEQGIQGPPGADGANSWSDLDDDHDAHDHTGVPGVGGSGASARYVRTAGNYTINGVGSTAFANVDNTNLNLSITTGASRVLVSVTATAEVNNVAGGIVMDIELDGARLGGTTGGLMTWSTPVANEGQPVGFTYITDTLSAASHTFKLQWAQFNTSHTATLRGADPFLVFAVVEI